MTYSRTILARIGKEVIARYPDIAAPIIEGLPEASGHDLDDMGFLFTRYCRNNGVSPEQFTEVLYKPEITEARKIFVCAMFQIYSGQRNFQKKMAVTIKRGRPNVSQILTEVRSRYKFDKDFREKVDITLQNIAA